MPDSGERGLGDEELRKLRDNVPVVEWDHEPEPLVVMTADLGRRLLARLDAAENVCIDAENIGGWECANFGEGSKYKCYNEPEQGWAVELSPCLFCALAEWRAACGRES